MADRLSRGVLVARAAELADEIGLDRVTITRVGHAVGIAPPGVYRHVADAEDLRGAIGALAASEAARELAAASSGLAGRDALTALADTLRDWARRHPGRYAALQIAPDPDVVLGTASATEVLAVIGAALRDYALDGDDFTDAVRLVRSTIHGFIGLEQGGGFRQPRDLDASFRRIVDALDAVLRGWVREPARAGRGAA